MKRRDLVDPFFDGPAHEPHQQVPGLVGLTLEEAVRAAGDAEYVSVRVTDLDSDQDEPAWTADFYRNRLNLALAGGKVVRAALF
jgi:hypothetical protein